MKNKHEELGIKYLIEKLGYNRKSIIINVTSNTNGTSKRGFPDLTTWDKKEWEVKQLENMSTVTFTLDQYISFDDDVNVLIFKKWNYLVEGEDPFLACIKFGDIRNQTENFGYIEKRDGKRYNLRFMVAYKVDICIAEEMAIVIVDKRYNEVKI